MRIGSGKVENLLSAVIGRRPADINAYVAPAECRRSQTGIIEGVGCYFKQQALLRIKLDRFARRYPESGAIKAPHIIDIARCECITLSGNARHRIEMASDRKPVIVN